MQELSLIGIAIFSSSSGFKSEEPSNEMSQEYSSHELSNDSVQHIEGMDKSSVVKQGSFEFSPPPPQA